MWLIHWQYSISTLARLLIVDLVDRVAPLLSKYLCIVHYLWITLWAETYGTAPVTDQLCSIIHRTLYSGRLICHSPLRHNLPLLVSSRCACSATQPFIYNRLHHARVPQ